MLSSDYLFYQSSLGFARLTSNSEISIAPKVRRSVAAASVGADSTQKLLRKLPLLRLRVQPIPGYILFIITDFKTVSDRAISKLIVLQLLSINLHQY